MNKSKTNARLILQAQKYTATSDDQVFSENELGKTREGKNLSTYRELCSLASDLNQPDLIYKYALKICDAACTDIPILSFKILLLLNSISTAHLNQAILTLFQVHEPGES